jgi:uncharacterized Fe-S cluster-containing radical SAM superfamily protein
MSPTFCPLPWSALANQPFGICLCCCSNHNLREGQETLTETFIGPRMQALRTQMLNGEWPKECASCQTAEAKGRSSYRQRWSEWQVYKNIIQLHAQEALTDLPIGLQFLELADDNLCNLKCRMCNPQYSTKWQEDLPQLKPLNIKPESFFQVRSPADIDLDPASYIFKDLQMIMLKGGEPLLNKRHVEFLRGLAKVGIAKNIALRITTNCTVIPPSYLEIIPEFKIVEMIVSIDGIDPLFRYIRHGRYTIADIKRNMDTLANAGVRLGVTTAYQIYNMLSYADIVRDFRSYTTFFSWQYVNTKGLGAYNAPTTLRQQALAQLHEIPTEGLAPITDTRIKKLIEQLSTGQFDLAQWTAFKRFTLALDNIRGESLAEVAPQIAAYLDVTEDC